MVLRCHRRAQTRTSLVSESPGLLPHLSPQSSALVLVRVARRMCAPSVLRRDGVWYLTNTATHEQCRLEAPAGEWHLGFTDDGDSFICDNDENLFECSSALRYEVLEDDSGNRFVNDREEEECVGFNDFFSKFELVSTSLKIGDCNTWCDIQCCMHVHRQRTGDRLHVSLYDTMAVLGLAVGPTRSKYVYTMWPSWERFLTRIGLEGCLRRAAPTAKQRQADTPGHEERNASFPTVSLIGLLAIVARWAFTTSKKKGGLSNDEDRGRSKAFLDALLRILPRRKWKLRLFATGFAYRFPSLSDGEGIFTLEIENGMVDMKPFDDLQPPHDFVNLMHVDGQKQPVSRLFELELYMGDPHSACFRQLVCEFGRVLDDSITTAFDKGVKEQVADVNINDHLMLTAAGKDWSTKSQVERGILAYMTDGYRMMQGQLHISCALDSSRICGLGVANGAIVLPTNDAFWCCPQVCVHGG